LTGEINNKKGQVKVEINKVFQILLSVFLCFPILGLIAQIIAERGNGSILFLPVAIFQFLMIRLFIEIVFRRFSKANLNRLSDVLDIEYLKQN
jgi:hypothetical protein